jgi:adenine-specific DNA-methyltransferase
MVNNKFPFPKSITTVFDCLKAVVKSKDALILDFFAGSGTTGHAVMMLNEEDGGNRKFILCTNNENNIALEITHPRIKAVVNGYEDVKGIPANVRYFKTSFVSKSKVSDDTRNSLVRKSAEMICVRENTFAKVIDKKGYKIYRNHNLVTGVLFDLDEIDTFKEEIAELGTLAHIYVFSLTNDTYSSDFQDLV